MWNVRSVVTVEDTCMLQTVSFVRQYEINQIEFEAQVLKDITKV